MSRALKQNDVLELSKLYEAEFNKPDLHDRVLVFDVVGNVLWQHKICVPNVENERNEGEASSESEDESECESEYESEYEYPVQTEKDGTIPTPSKLIPVLKKVAMDSKISDASETQCNVNVSECNEKKSESHDYEMAIDSEHKQRNENDASNKIEGEQIQTATEANENDIVLKENVEINQNRSNENETKTKQDSEIAKGTTDESSTSNHKEQSENSSEASSESNEVSHLNSKEEIILQHKFYIHSSWLAVQSSYFRSLFFCGMKESNAKEVHVQILASEEQAHLMLVKAMYKIDILNNVSVGELLEILRLAHKYDVKFVFKKCKYCLQATVVSLDICEQIMRFIKVDNTITGVEDLVSTLQCFLAKEFSPLDKTWQTTSFKELCEPSLKYLLSGDELTTASENTIFHALVYWIEQTGIDNLSESQDLPSLLSVVRFELIPIDYLYNIVQHNSVAKKLVDFNDHYLRGISYHALSDSMKKRLPRQPVKRKASTELFIPYTWVIPRDKLDKLVVGTDKKLKSDEFWYCGYKMVLLIHHVVKLRNLQENKAIFKATLSLAIIYLTRQSEVIIQWQPESRSFRTTPEEQVYTFNRRAPMSSVDINYTIEIKTKESTAHQATTKRSESLFQAAVINNSGGFNVSFPQTSVSPKAGKAAPIYIFGSPPPTPTPCLSIDVNMNLV